MIHSATSREPEDFCPDRVVGPFRWGKPIVQMRKYGVQVVMEPVDAAQGEAEESTLVCQELQEVGIFPFCLKNV